MPEDKVGEATTTSASKTVVKKRAGFNDKNEPYPGVDPDTGERKAVTFEGLKAEFGAKEGERIYFEISRLGGHGITEQNQIDNYPPLSLTGMKKQDVDAVFAAAKE